MSTIDTLLTDSDGTLVNTPDLIRHGQFEASKQYLTHHGIPAEDIPTFSVYDGFLHQTVGGRTRDTIESTVRLLYQHQPDYLTGIDFDELYSLLDPIQDRLAPEYIKAYPGLDELFANLGRMGIKLGIFSSGDQRMIVRNIGFALPELGLFDLYKDPKFSNQEKLDLFTNTVKDRYKLPAFTVVTSDDTDAHKPNPAGLNLALQRLGSEPARTAGMGDHKFDMQASSNAGLPVRIGVTHGFDDEAALRAAGATDIIELLSEVPAILAGK